MTYPPVPLGFDPGVYLPKILPSRWKLVKGGGIGDDGALYVDRIGQRSVIVSMATEQDGRLWMHASIARSKRMPTWDDVMDLKDVFIGRDRTAYQVIPARAKHINIHKNCLHLFSPLEGEPPLPDFTQGGNSL